MFHRRKPASGVKPFRDGAIDILDVIALNKFLLGGSKLDTDAQKRSDSDGNSKLESADSLNILKYVLEIIKDLPIKK